jgi:hypothetical protein
MSATPPRLQPIEPDAGAVAQQVQYLASQSTAPGGGFRDAVRHALILPLVDDAIGDAVEEGVIDRLAIRRSFLPSS